jgi:E3 ubiquitin-protein ligase RNF19A
VRTHLLSLVRRAGKWVHYVNGPHTRCVQYITLATNESRVALSCWKCDIPLHPIDIRRVLGGENANVYDKYEQYTLRRALVVDADTRWCPAPDCTYACIASNCAACPELQCAVCPTRFCYHCKAVWHSSQTCEEARIARGLAHGSVHDMITTTESGVIRRKCARPCSALVCSVLAGSIRACPRCQTYIAKMDDGSCNHMTCGWCGADFCWLCLKQVSDLHYLS